MDLPAFYHTEISKGELILDEKEAHHAIKVMRLNKDDQLFLMDGKGTTGLATIASIVKKEVRVNCHEVTQHDRRYKKIHLAIAPTKKWDRMSFLIEKLTEIGVAEITPIICQNSEQRFWKEPKAQNVIIAAMKQSRNPFLPIIHPMIKFKDFINGSSENTFIAHCKEQDRIALTPELYQNKKEACIVIGPEGDFTTEEISIAENSGVKSVTLGTTRLRTETAGLVSVIKMLEI